LTTLNEPVFVECARALAARTLREGGATDEARLTYAFRRCLARKPSPQEAAVLLELLRRPARAKVQPASSERPSPGSLPPGVKPEQLDAWTVVTRVLLNLDETITRE
jgi:hypothetical protein